jgi:hypothetical protein
VVPRQVLEQIRHVLPERGVAREHAKVGVNARRPRVVVPRPDVAVRAETRFFLAHDHGALAVGLEAHQPVGHVAAGVLELLGEAHVAGLVEAGLELDQDGDLGEREVKSGKTRPLLFFGLTGMRYTSRLIDIAGLVIAGFELEQDGDLGERKPRSGKTRPLWFLIEKYLLYLSSFIGSCRPSCNRFELDQDGDLGVATNMSAKQGLCYDSRERAFWIP